MRLRRLSAVSITLTITLSTTAVAVGQGPRLLVASRNTDEILAYDGTGAFAGSFASGGGLDNPVGITFGPDGHLWVASGNTNQILRFDGATGAPLGVFAGVASPRNLTFGPDGNLYVCSGTTASVVAFTPAGTPLGTFASGAAISGNTSLTFGPDFDLYVGSVFNSQVVRFDGRTGALVGVFANTGMNGTGELSFGPDGDLYVCNSFGNNVTKHDGATGAFVGVFVQDPALNVPLGLTWDSSGNLLVANQLADEVRRYDGATGALLGVFVTAGLGGLDGPMFATFEPRPGGVQLPPPSPGVAGQVSLFEVRGAVPGGAVALGAGTLAGSLALPCPGLVVSIADVFLLAAGAADESGRLLHSMPIPAGAQGLGFLLQAVDVTGCSVSTVRSHVF